MLLIILPVMALTVIFAWRYRQSNSAARYDPEWHHSTILELVIWAAPLAIIVCLGAVTYLGTHLLDPYRPLARIDAARAVTAEDEPLEIQVVSLDWKWLFLYPQYGVATVNEVAAPVDRPIHFKITSNEVMNAFYIPALAGMIYSMAGMETQLHAVINAEGDYEGFSSNYSGAGFSGMRFTFKGTDGAGFDEWIAAAKADATALDTDRYLELVKPSENVPVMRFASVEDGLYTRILNMCVAPGTTCMSEMMAIDAMTGAGHGPHSEHAAAGSIATDIMCGITGADGVAPGIANVSFASVAAHVHEDRRPVGMADGGIAPTNGPKIRGAGLPQPNSDVRVSDALPEDHINF